MNSVSTFSRSFALPGDADEDRISTQSDNGILRVRVPKIAVKEPGSIEIEIK